MEQIKSEFITAQQSVVKLQQQLLDVQGKQLDKMMTKESSLTVRLFHELSRKSAHILFEDKLKKRYMKRQLTTIDQKMGCYADYQQNIQRIQTVE